MPKFDCNTPCLGRPLYCLIALQILIWFSLQKSCYSLTGWMTREAGKGTPGLHSQEAGGCEVDIYRVRVKSGQKNTSKAEKED